MAGSNSSSARRFIVLDTWVLAGFTQGLVANNLSILISELELTILVDTYALIELFNPSWFRLPFIGRTRAATEFLIDHPSCLLDPQRLLLAEVRGYPTPADPLSVAMDLAALHWSTREYLLGGLFQRSTDLAAMGLDLQAWAQDYKGSKSRWPSTVQAIIDHAASAGILRKRKDGAVDVAGSDKEAFLRYLDRRFLKVQFHKDADIPVQLHLANNIDALSYGATSSLPAVRLTSLGFWHAYVETDKGYPTPRKGSDIGDLYRFALLPYASHFTVDTAMGRVLQRVLKDSPQTATVLSPADFRSLLDAYAPEPGAFLHY